MISRFFFIHAVRKEWSMDHILKNTKIKQFVVLGYSLSKRKILKYVDVLISECRKDQKRKKESKMKSNIVKLGFAVIQVFCSLVIILKNTEWCVNFRNT